MVLLPLSYGGKKGAEAPVYHSLRQSS